MVDEVAGAGDFLSSTSRLALADAHDEARRAGAQAPLPAHLFIALVQLCEKDLSADQEPERGELRNALAWTGLDAKISSGRVRSALTDGEASRDETSAGLADVLARARQRAGDLSQATVRLVDLLWALAERDWNLSRKLFAAIQIRKEDVLGRLSRPSRGRRPGGRRRGTERTVPLETRPEAAARVPLTEAVLALDMCDSTETGQTYGEQFFLRQKAAVEGSVLAAAKTHRAATVKGTGDGYMMTFADCESAVLAARRILADVRQYNDAGPARQPLGLRIGIHFGEVFAEPGGDRSGLAVNLAFRLQETKAEAMHETRQGIAKALLPSRDRIFISHNVFKQLSAQRSGIQCFKVGYFDLKGFEGLRVAVYEVWPTPEG